MNEFLRSIGRSLAASFDPDALGTQFARLLANVIVAAFVFAAFYLVWRILRPLLRHGLERAKVDPTNASFIMAAAQMVILTVGTVHALAAVGVNMGALFASLGIAGLTIGFAARDALSNIISGVLIFWDRPFVIGDLVEVDGAYGRVDAITLRSTRVVTPDGRMLAVPNTQIINTIVASYTNFPHLRIDVEATIGVNEDLGRVRRVMLGVVESDPAFMRDPPPAMLVKALGDYNLTVEVQAWIDDERRHGVMRAELRERLYEALREAGVDMPFETLQIRPVEVKARVAPEAGAR